MPRDCGVQGTCQRVIYKGAGHALHDAGEKQRLDEAKEIVKAEELWDRMKKDA